MKIDKYLIREDATVREAIEAIDAGKKKLVFIVDKNHKLLGIFADGDMRRYILKNGDISSQIDEVMNKNPLVFLNRKDANEAIKKDKLVAAPIVDLQGVLIEIVFPEDEQDDEVVSQDLQDIKLVLMAGGIGSRLNPFTKVLPKALIPIGDFTISERIIKSFLKYGCKEVVMILKHKASLIKAYFNDLSKTYNVEYIEEEEFLGTGGGLSLLKGKLKDSFFVSNCDILINASFQSILDYHKKEKNKITFVCAMKNITVPYGVVNLKDNGQIKNIVEKPELSFLTNTGLYVLEPSVIEELVEGEFIHLPDIAKKYLDKGENVGVFPISEKSWLDMGQYSEMEAMFKDLGI